MNCANYTYKEEAQYHEFTVGSLVGTLFGVNVNNCSSSAEIDIVQCVKQGTTKEIRPAIGGVFGAERECSVAREISKKFEEHKRGTLVEVASWYKEHEPKGEIVIIVSGAPEIKKKKKDSCNSRSDS